MTVSRPPAILWCLGLSLSTSQSSQFVNGYFQFTAHQTYELFAFFSHIHAPLQINLVYDLLLVTGRCDTAGTKKKRRERQTHYLEKTAYMCKLCLRTCQESRFSVQNLKFWFIISGDDEFLNADFSETLVISLIFTEWLTQMIVVAPHETISVWTGP